MAMKFTETYAIQALDRLAALPEDRVPRWGVLRKATLVEHLIWSVCGSLGEVDALVYRGNLLTRHVVRPVILYGLLPMPRNVQLLGPGVPMGMPGGLEDLRAAIARFHAAVKVPDFTFAPHPVFGALGARGWDRMHYRHFQHHLKQFGA